MLQIGHFRDSCKAFEVKASALASALGSAILNKGFPKSKCQGLIERGLGLRMFPSHLSQILLFAETLAYSKKGCTPV